MNVSPVQSSSKCRLDFSIERILSDDSRVRETRVEVPSWLCCTRYQPPRIPLRSNLEYASQVWNPMDAVYINRIETIQRKFIRYLCFRTKTRYNSDDYLAVCRKHHLLTLEARRNIADITGGVPSSSACRARRSGRHARVPFTAAQAAALEAAYARAPYLAPPALRALAAALQLRDDRIKIWFQNRRARERREKCANITPPQAVTLRPTTVMQTPTVSVPTHSWHSHQVLTESPRDLSNSPLHSATHNSRNRCLSSYSEAGEEQERRSETPLDVETVERQ